MAELTAKSPCEGLLPFSTGSADLTELWPDHMTLIAPYKGQEDASSKALKTAHGVALPAIGGSEGDREVRVIWFARGQSLLIGPKADASLDATAAVTELTDGWAVVELKGKGVADVLARLSPLDFRLSHFPTGTSARTELKHMMASITRTSDEAFQIMVFRSMAATLVHDLKTAMEAVAARG